MDCDDLTEMTAELALGVLTGRERAQASMHLDRCGTCRERIQDLALTGDELLGLLPGREPPAGFETRVMGRLGFTGRHRRHLPGRPRWMLAATAATAATIIAVASQVNARPGRDPLDRGHGRVRSRVATVVLACGHPSPRGG